jgi:hypothetical protein
MASDDESPEHLKSLRQHVLNVVDEQLYDLDPVRVRARRRREAALARGRQVEDYDFGSPLHRANKLRPGEPTREQIIAAAVFVRGEPPYPGTMDGLPPLGGGGL